MSTVREEALRRRSRGVRHSIAVLSLAEIKNMVNDMFEQSRDYLPQFASTRV